MLTLHFIITIYFFSVAPFDDCYVSSAHIRILTDQLPPVSFPVSLNRYRIETLFNASVNSTVAGSSYLYTQFGVANGSSNDDGNILKQLEPEIITDSSSVLLKADVDTKDAEVFIDMTPCQQSVCKRIDALAHSNTGVPILSGCCSSTSSPSLIYTGFNYDFLVSLITALDREFDFSHYHLVTSLNWAEVGKRVVQSFKKDQALVTYEFFCQNYMIDGYLCPEFIPTNVDFIDSPVILLVVETIEQVEDILLKSEIELERGKAFFAILPPYSQPEVIRHLTHTGLLVPLYVPSTTLLLASNGSLPMNADLVCFFINS